MESIMKKNFIRYLALALVLCFVLGNCVTVFAWDSPKTIGAAGTTWGYGDPFNYPYNLDTYSGSEQTVYQWPFTDDKYAAGKYIIDGYGTDGAVDGTGRMPLMGWNSWNAYGNNFVSAQAIKDTATAFDALGLTELGYKYIVIDDGCYRDNSSSNLRAPQGTAQPFMRPHATRFPEVESGVHPFRDVSDHVHSLGMKYGMYTNSSNRTCAGQMGSWGYEDIDAQKYIEWGLDYLKYDFCSSPWAGDGSGGAYLAGPRIIKLTVKDASDAVVQTVNAADMEVFGAARKHGGTGTTILPSVYNIGGYWKDIPIINGLNWENKNGDAFSADFRRQIGGAPPVTSELAALAITPGEALATVTVPTDGTYTIDYNYSTQQITGIPSERPPGTEGWNYSATYSTSTAGRYIQVDNVTSLIADYRAYVGKGAKRIFAFKNEPFIQKYDYNLRVFERLVAAANSTNGNTVSFTVDLKAGENFLRLYSEKRTEGALESYGAMKESLTRAAVADGRDEDIILSICEWGYNEGSKWGYKVGEGWRATRDILSVGGNATIIARSSTELAGWYDPVWAPGANNGNGGYVGTSGIRGIKYCYDRTVYRHMDDFNIGLGYGWNDADMMAIGHRDLTTYRGAGTSYNADNIQFTRFERRLDESHFNSWTMMNSVIMLGTRMFDVNSNGTKAAVNTITKDTPFIQVLSNKDSIALQQDPLAIQGKRIKCSDGSDPYGLVITERVDALAKPLANGDMAVMIFNLDAGHRYADKSHADYRKSGMSIKVDEIIAGIGHHMVNKDEFASAKSYLVKEINTKEVRTWKSGDELSVAYPEILDLEPFWSMTFRISPNVSIADKVEVFDSFDADADDAVFAPKFSLLASEAMSVNLYAAAFDADGRLLDVNQSSATLVAGTIAELQTSIPKNPKAAEYKFFVWDSNFNVLTSITSF